MHQHQSVCLKSSTRPLALAAAALLSATLFAGVAHAQQVVPAPKAKAAAKPTPAKQASGPALPLVSKAPEPTFDEGTAQRIANAMLSYSALEVRGGWPTMPRQRRQPCAGCAGGRK